VSIVTSARLLSTVVQLKGAQHAAIDQSKSDKNDNEAHVDLRLMFTCTFANAANNRPGIFSSWIAA